MSIHLSTRLINTSIVTITTVIVTVFLYNVSDNSSQELKISSIKDISPDYLLSSSISKQYNEDGLLTLSVNAQSIVHSPENKSAKMRQPYFEVYENNQLIWTITADHGTVSDQGNRIELEQRIVIASEDKSTSLKTPALTLLTDQKIMKTEKNVTLTSPNGFSRSVGMEAKLESEDIHLMKQVVGQYEPTVD